MGGVHTGRWVVGLGALILCLTCPGGNAPAGHRGSGFGVSTSGLHLVVLCGSLKLVGADGRRGGWNGVALQLLCPLVPGAGCSRLPVFRKPSRKSKQSPVLRPRLPPDLCLHPACVQAVRLPAAQYSCVLSQACGWVSKPHILEIGLAQTPADPPGDDLASLLPGAGKSQKMAADGTAARSSW